MPTRSGVTVQTDEELFIRVLPERIQALLARHEDQGALLEVILDLGRHAEARFARGIVQLTQAADGAALPVVSEDDIRGVTDRIGEFGGDNRAGIERTLHRISAIRNRRGKIIGLTCRVGRAVYGTIDIIEDIIETGRSILVLGRPGIGKTTKLREIARVLSDTFGRRVVVVDTSNEIGGDGDIPHPAIGRARRMQVATPLEQHAVMIEAVENHMPEVIVIDEIGTEDEARASRTIAERGVQLVATAHGNTLENVLMNPTLSDLVGGVQAVTLGDEEARRRGTQKTVLERRSPPTFDVVIEMVEMDELAVHHDVASSVDTLLRGFAPPHEVRWRGESGQVETRKVRASEGNGKRADGPLTEGTPIEGRLLTEAEQEELALEGRNVARIFSYGISRDRIEQALHELGVRAVITKDWKDADFIVTMRVHQKRFRTKMGGVPADVPIHYLRGKSYGQVFECLREALDVDRVSGEEKALEQARSAIQRVLDGEEFVELKPQNSYIRKQQHELAAAFQMGSRSVGREPFRRVVVMGSGG
jgi:stage III sporulation protein SpoIIIAA